MMFPYPSAEGLHVGNVYAFTGADIYGRFMSMQGDDVFEPMGFDAFGIHSEAIEDYPDRFAKLNETLKATFDDPKLQPAMEQAGQPWDLVRYGDQEACMDYALRTMELAERFKPLLTGQPDDD